MPTGSQMNGMPPGIALATTVKPRGAGPLALVDHVRLTSCPVTVAGRSTGASLRT